MTLNTQIQETIQMFREHLPAELNDLIETGASDIEAMPIAVGALKAGDKAPEFTLKNYNGEARSLSDYLKDGPLVLTFYRGLWCPYCNLQLAAYNAGLAEIKAAGGSLVAISPEGPEGLETVNESEMPQKAKDTVVSAPDFDVLHDAGTSLARQYKLVFELPESHKELLGLLKVNLEKANGDDSYAFADPATYIIGTDGEIKWAYVPNNYRKRAEVADIVAELKKL